ncbi:Polyprenol-phosphate-mannose-dependent alpha-(1-2)-phosphatidylinositol mannoside mannosyltransferase [Corynebacterium caspium DSM 44850]|nr:Polyprenol-phosphate-mannose-dependent alpha-(1-2)-phosphatidylinositol mannoside mannosyltransferase [Corynebacterium caspium DSM 44850]
MVQHLRITDFPVDMIIYREGVKAFFSGGQVYTQPMIAGDIALPFIYPPFSVLALGPLVLPFIGHTLAGNIMVTASSLLLLWCLKAIFKTCITNSAQLKHIFAGWDIPLAALMWPVAMLMEPVHLNDGFAQINTVIMALVIADLIPRQRKIPQGWLIGLAIAIKISPAAMLLFFLLKKQYRPILVASISAIIATAAAAIIRWDQAVIFFSSTLLSMSSNSEFGVDSTYTSNSSIKAVLMRAAPSREWLATHHTALNIAWALAVIITVILAGWLMKKLLNKGLEIHAWMVNALIMLLISPISWSHHWVWLAVIIPTLTLWLLGQYQAKLPWKATAIVSLIFAAIVLTVPPKWWFGDGVAFTDLNFWAKFLVSDFVWLAYALIAALAWDTKVKQHS